MNQKGFISLPLMAWGAIGAAVVIAGLGVAVKVQTSRLDTAKAETVAVQGRFDAFVAQAKAIGEAQEAKARETNAVNLKAKERADAQNVVAKGDLARLYGAYAKLRDSRAPGSDSSLVPRAAPSAPNPALVTFDRVALDNALSGFDRGVTGLLGEGDQAIVDLSTAREWSKSR